MSAFRVFLTTAILAISSIWTLQAWAYGPVIVFKDQGKTYSGNEKDHWRLIEDAQAQDDAKLQSHNMYRIGGENACVLKACLLGKGCAKRLRAWANAASDNGSDEAYLQCEVQIFELANNIKITLGDKGRGLAVFIDTTSSSPFIQYESASSTIDVDHKKIILTRLVSGTKDETDILARDICSGVKDLIMSVPYRVKELKYHDNKLYAFGLKHSVPDIGSYFFSWTGHYSRKFDWFLLKIDLKNASLEEAILIKEGVRLGEGYFKNKWIPDEAP